MADHIARGAAAVREVERLREVLMTVRDCSSQEWQQADGKRMGATDNSGRRMWFITDDVMQAVRDALGVMVRDPDEPQPPETLVDAPTDRAHEPEKLRPCTRGGPAVHPGDELGNFARWFVKEYGYAPDHREQRTVEQFKAWCAARPAGVALPDGGKNG